MAIKFLSGIDLNQNELNNAQIQNLAADPGTGVEGQIYFNTATDKLRVYANSSWGDVAPQGDITAVSVRATGNSAQQLQIANATGPIPSFEILTGAVADGQNYLVDSQAVFNAISASGGGTVTAVTATAPVASSGGTTPDISMAAATTSVSGYLTSTDWNTFNNKSSTVGTVTSVTSGDTDTITIGGTAAAPTVAANTAAVSDGGTNLATGGDIYNFVTDFGYTTNTGTVEDVTAGDGIRITGTSTVNPTVSVSYATAANYIEVASAATADGENYIPMADASNDVKKTKLKDVPMAALGAVKTYVDNAVGGASSFQGGYNASTNVPNLDSTPTISILQGFQWAVTADGLFFTEQVRIGDLIIANSDSPTALADWTTVQGNVDLASTTVAGIASFSSDNFAVSAAGAVTIKNNGVILGTETTGNYVESITTVGDGLTGGVASEGSTAALSLTLGSIGQGVGTDFVMADSGTAGSQYLAPLADAASSINSANTHAATITANATVTHNLGTKDVIVQLYDIVTFDTVHADVDRASTNTVGISFGATPTNSIRVLIQKIG